MMKPIKLRGVALGEGRPKICVPLTGAGMREVLEQASLAKLAGADMVEWRADYFRDWADSEKVLAGLRRLRGAAGQTPVLFTLRTAGEGGRQAPDAESYVRLLAAAAASGLADAVDVELAAGQAAVRQAAAAARRGGAAVVVSSHNFAGTPDAADMAARLSQMREWGADVPKLAVMPADFADVLALMSAVYQYTRAAGVPVIAMAMGEVGCISRVAGQYFGSALTFGSVRQASAPGQLAVADLRAALDILAWPDGAV